MAAVFGDGALKGGCVWAVRRHAHMQACTCAINTHASILVEMGHLTPTAAAPARWPLTTTVQEVHHPGSCLPFLQREHSGCKVRACTSRNKASLLGLVGAIDEAHELRHHIAVVVRRPEGVVRNRPAWREHHEVCCGCACGQPTTLSPIPVQAEHELASYIGFAHKGSNLCSSSLGELLAEDACLGCARGRSGR